MTKDLCAGDSASPSRWLLNKHRCVGSVGNEKCVNVVCSSKAVLPRNGRSQSAEYARGWAKWCRARREASMPLAQHARQIACVARIAKSPPPDRVGALVSRRLDAIADSRRSGRTPQPSSIQHALEPLSAFGVRTDDRAKSCPIRRRFEGRTSPAHASNNTTTRSYSMNARAPTKLGSIVIPYFFPPLTVHRSAFIIRVDHSRRRTITVIIALPVSGKAFGERCFTLKTSVPTSVSGNAPRLRARAAAHETHQEDCTPEAVPWALARNRTLRLISFRIINASPLTCLVVSYRTHRAGCSSPICTPKSGCNPWFPSAKHGRSRRLTANNGSVDWRTSGRSRSSPREAGVGSALQIGICTDRACVCSCARGVIALELLVVPRGKSLESESAWRLRTWGCSSLQRQPPSRMSDARSRGSR